MSPSRRCPRPRMGPALSRDGTGGGAARPRAPWHRP